MKIGVCLPSIGLSFEEALVECPCLGIQGLQIWPVREFSPEQLDQEARKSLRERVGSHQVEICALGGGLNLMIPEKHQEHVERFKRFLELSCDLGANIVTTESKGIPPGISEEKAWDLLVQGVGEIVSHAQRLGAFLAIELGPKCLLDTPEKFLKLAGEVRNPHLKVNYDPANVIMRGLDPLEGLRELGGFVVHTHVKDAIHYPNGRYTEVPLGKGDLQLPAYIDALKEIPYNGYLTIEREAGEDPLGDVRMAVELLQGFLE